MFFFSADCLQTLETSSLAPMMLEGAQLTGGLSVVMVTLMQSPLASNASVNDVYASLVCRNEIFADTNFCELAFT